jgi:mono/diheme cytochrome c family protein
MRYFFLIWFFLCVAVVSIAGFRGGMSRKPPIELFPDMDRQPKLRPQTEFGFFTNNFSSRLPVSGTIAHTKSRKVGDQDVFPHEEHPFNTGRVAGTTNFVEVNPLPISEKLLARGQQRFQIYCSPCHGMQADGNGITKKVGAMPIVANLHDARIVRQFDGEIFNTITFGKNLMGSYAPQVAVEDRWAIIAYLRTLQRSHLGTLDDVPAGERASLPNVPPPGAVKPAAAEAKK